MFFGVGTSKLKRKKIQKEEKQSESENVVTRRLFSLTF